MTEKIEEIKVVVIGDGTVGKTCLLQTYVENAYPKEYIMTVFENHSTDKVVEIGQGDEKEVIKVSLSLWDTAGQEEYGSLRPISYPDTDVFLICYAVNNRTSLSNVENKWAPEIRECKKVRDGTPIILVGLKADLRSHDDNVNQSVGNLVPLEDCDSMSKKIKCCKHLECSALKREGLNTVFDEAMRCVVELRRKPEKKKNRRCVIM